MSAKSPRARPNRSAGVLLHPTSLPGPYGIGDFGSSSYHWVDALADARQTWWQILPLGPTGFGDSPYQAFSAFAGNPNLISPEELVREGLLQTDDVQHASFPTDHVDYPAVIEFKRGLLNTAWRNFQAGATPALSSPFRDFCRTEASWLDDYALFRALKEAHSGASWSEWPRPLAMHDPAALAKARAELANDVGLHQFGQFLVARQWSELKAYANQQGVRLIGDIPIFVSGDSADVWAHPDLFQLDAERRPRVVAGVPPDYFSATGQLWGNPLYDWERLKATGFAWWAARLKATLAQVDLIRLDHFRGFAAYWEIPAGMPTAEKGRWVEAPGAELLTTLRGELGRLPLIAEDLGVITPDVEELRDRFELPGMRILQFAFGGATESRFLPHNFEHNTVVYTGTHDNDTTRGWYEAIGEDERHFVRSYVATDGRDIAWDLIRLAWSSAADYAVAPLQDLLDLGTEARMNLPGRPAGNWRWRFTAEQLTSNVVGRLGELTHLYSREQIPKQTK